MIQTFPLPLPIAVSGPRWVRWIVLVSIIVLPTTVAAKSDAPEEECPTYLAPEQRNDPAELALNGVACFQAEHYDWALTYYTAAYSLEPDSFLLGGIGRSLHELGIYEPAADYYQRFLHAEQTPYGTDRIRQRVDELEVIRDKEGTTAVLHSQPSGVTAYLVLDNGHWHELGTTPLEVELREGKYQFAFHSPGFRPRLVSKSLGSADSVKVESDLVSEESALNISDRRRRSAGTWMMATAVPATAAGATMVVLAMNDDDRQSLRTPGTITSAAGITILLTGAILYLSASSSEDPVPATELDALSADSRSFRPTMGINHLGFRLDF